MEEILDYIKLCPNERQYFDKNGNRDIYEKFKSDENLRHFHSQLHYFLQYHLPMTEAGHDQDQDEQKAEESLQTNQNPRSCLKKKQYDLNIH